MKITMKLTKEEDQNYAEALKVLDELWDSGLAEKLFKLEPDGFLAIICTAIDGYAMVNGLKSKDIVDKIRSVVTKVNRKFRRL
jgi:hypothetical protein